MQEKTPPFRSASFYVTLVLTILLPFGLWIVGSATYDFVKEFELKVSRLTILFMNSWLPVLLLTLPLGVVVKEMLFHDQAMRHRCDVIFAVLVVVVLVSAGFSLPASLHDLFNPLTP